MHDYEVEKSLESMTLIVDTREQMTDRLKARLESSGLPYIRKKLNCGDYSAFCDKVDLSDSVVIERKMNLDELAMCLGTQRKRFEREFIRAKESQTKVYLLIENASWDVLFNNSSYLMRCHSKYSAKSMVSSLFAWMSRYNITVVFCNEDNTGKIIREILYREMKERLRCLKVDS